MPQIVLKAKINAPAAEVFAILDDPKLTPLYAKAVNDDLPARRTSGRIGDVFAATYSILGIKFRSNFTITEFENPVRLRVVAKGVVNLDIAYDLKEENGVTMVTNTGIYGFRTGSRQAKTIGNLILGKVLKRSMSQILEGIRGMAEQGVVTSSRSI